MQGSFTQKCLAYKIYVILYKITIKKVLCITKFEALGRIKSP